MSRNPVNSPRDFFLRKVLTWRGWKGYFVLVFQHVNSRRVFVSPATRKPDGEWVAAQAAVFVRHFEATPQGTAGRCCFATGMGTPAAKSIRCCDDPA